MTKDRYGRHAGAGAVRRRKRATLAVRVTVAVVAVVAVLALVVAGTMVLRPDLLGSVARDMTNSSRTSAVADAGERSSADGTSAANTSVAAGGAISRSGVPAPNAKAVKQTEMDALSQALQSKIAGYQGTWQVYAEDLASGAKLSINSHRGYAASVIKLYVMLAVFQQIADGTLAEDADVDQLLTQMITVSSNEATNSLIAKVGGGDTETGFGVVNDTAARYGFSDSHINQILGDINGDPNRKTTTADDAGRFMAAVYRGELVSKDYSRRMLDLLLGQTRRTKIPGGVPDGVKVANKTGEIDGVENDAAIVFAGDDTSAAMDGSATAGDYVLVVMTSEVSSAAAQASIRDLSAAVWEALK